MKKLSRTRKRKKQHLWKAAMLILSAGLLTLSLGLAFLRPFAALDSASSSQKESLADTNGPANAIRRFSFVGFGDNLLHEPIYLYHEQDQGNRDFSDIYAPLVPYVQQADLAYLNFETICAGDELGLSGYPAFNGPLEMIDSLVQTGFDFFSCASNHSLDRHEAGLQTELSYLSGKYPQIAVSGARIDPERANDPVIIDVQGLKVGLAGFTYGTNGIAQTPGQEWMLDVYANDAGDINYDLIDRRMEALSAASDVQIITMHWGQEYQSEPNEQQLALARYLHEKGAEAIIGTHPHVLQRAEILKTGDQQTLVYYSLGNLLSAQNSNDTMVGGMANFTLCYDPSTKTASFENASLTPTITWISPDLRTYRTLTIHEYTDELAASHYIPNVEGQDLSRAWVQQYAASVFKNPQGITLIND